MYSYNWIIIIVVVHVAVITAYVCTSGGGPQNDDGAEVHTPGSQINKYSSTGKSVSLNFIIVKLSIIYNAAKQPALKSHMKSRH